MCVCDVPYIGGRQRQKMMNDTRSVSDKIGF